MYLYTIVHIDQRVTMCDYILHYVLTVRSPYIYITCIFIKFPFFSFQFTVMLNANLFNFSSKVHNISQCSIGRSEAGLKHA